MARNDAGQFVVAWTSENQDGTSHSVYARVFDMDGSELVPEFRVNDQRQWIQNDPVVTALDTGGFVIAWTDHNSTDGSGQGLAGLRWHPQGVGWRASAGGTPSDQTDPA